MMESLRGTLSLQGTTERGSSGDRMSFLLRSRQGSKDGQSTQPSRTTAPQALVSLLLPGVKFQGEQDKELKARTVEADLLYNVIWAGRKIILHVEFQVEADKNMARRVWEYNVLTDYLTSLPVYSVVIYLVKRCTIVESRYQAENAD